ncbi:type I-G CRISPR-associated helicase/endonuclease Cas3g [Desulfonatronum thiodismutans]|uniref:type I-G CRISPR-associated helicase/endonuclease Cas3g n=1 Tax=Desulfonatronum thiodismutans TaxID=159290 RepID=UPI0004ABDC8D|nr:type I-U CRISPR-associated helicase/endonuclease Cas3 [Desulfonatronum thiodismutans]
MDFAAGFSRLTGFSPLKWQTRLFTDCFSRGIVPAAVDLPTGLGKTSVMAIWKLALDSGASLPRRLIYVVDRRAVVDQATTEAEKIKAAYGDTALRVSTLRGQHVDNREWLDDPSASAIIVGTVDMIGSRLLFSGYGVSRKMRPYHAGLLGIDSLIVLDESHLVPPFERLMEAIETETALYGPRGEVDREILPRFRLLSLSATGRARQGVVFSLNKNKDDLNDEIVTKRLRAKKKLTLVPAGEKKLENKLVEEAWNLSGQGTEPVRIIIYCNERKVAEKVHADLLKRGKGIPYDNIQLLVGGRRVRERSDAARQLEQLGFLAGSTVQLEKPAFLVATSAGEVGIDLDADHMVCDLVPWERMVQRFGRVNRRGLGNARIIVVHEGEPKPKKAGEAEQAETTAMIAWRCCDLFEELENDDDGIDVSPWALLELKHRAAMDTKLLDLIESATTPPPLYPALTRALVDAWSMTSLEKHTGRPEIGPWLRGWVDEKPQTAVVWRAYLPVRTKGQPATREDVEGYFEAAPPHLSEKLEAETWKVVEWVTKCAATADQTNRLSKNGIVAFALTPSGDLKASFSLKELLEADKARKDQFNRLLASATLVLDARLGGLRNGLLDPKISDAVTEIGDVGAWREIPFRVTSNAEADAQQAGDKISFAFVTKRSPEGIDEERLEVITVTTEESRATASRPQLLEEHLAWAEAQARHLAKALGLPDEYAEVLALAAKLHDEGKRANRWQCAFNAPNDGIYAKTKGPVFPARLGGYRHEFGTLHRTLNNRDVHLLPDHLRDLVLHLIVSHHGHARPVVPTEGCEDAPPSQLIDRARETAIRFARLQKQWGPWGLAWWESLLRAADQQASRRNDNLEANNG